MEEPPACCVEPPRSRGTTDHGSEAIEIESLLDLLRDQLAVEPTPGGQKAPTLAFLPGTLASVANRRARNQRDPVVHHPRFDCRLLSALRRRDRCQRRT